MARRRNIEPVHWAIVGLGAVTVGVGGYVAYRLVQDWRRREEIKGLPPPPLSMDVGDPCGVQYPGFVFDGEACRPTENSPAGVYITDACTDFVFVQGDDGPQLDYLEAMIDAEAEASSSPASSSVDPTELATNFLERFWRTCRWPPDPEGPERIVQLYQAMSYVIGREILISGGRVLGTSDPDLVDEQIAERLSDLGFADFDPDLVDEIPLPDPFEMVGVIPPGSQSEVSAP